MMKGGFPIAPLTPFGVVHFLTYEDYCKNS